MLCGFKELPLKKINEFYNRYLNIKRMMQKIILTISEKVYP